MIWVSLQPRPYVWPSRSPAPLLDEGAMQEFTSSLSLRDCSTIAAMVEGELRRRGLWRARVGGRYYVAAEERVVADVVGLDLDLFEISAQIEEARWESNCT